MHGVRCLKTINICRPIRDNLKSRKAQVVVRKNEKAKLKDNWKNFALFELKIRSNSKHFLWQAIKLNVYRRDGWYSISWKYVDCDAFFSTSRCETHLASYSFLVGSLYERIEELAVKLADPFHLTLGFSVSGDLRLCALMLSHTDNIYIHLTVAGCIVQNSTS